MQEKGMVSIGYVMRELHVAPQTVRNWAKRGILVPDYVSEKGTRYYKPETIEKFKKERKS